MVNAKKYNKTFLKYIENRVVFVIYFQKIVLSHVLQNLKLIKLLKSILYL